MSGIWHKVTEEQLGQWASNGRKTTQDLMGKTVEICCGPSHDRFLWYGKVEAICMGIWGSTRNPSYLVVSGKSPKKDKVNLLPDPGNWQLRAILEEGETS